MKLDLTACLILASQRPDGKDSHCRNRFVREAVLKQGYLASQVGDFLACHPSNVSRALQKN